MCFYYTLAKAALQALFMHAGDAARHAVSAAPDTQGASGAGSSRNNLCTNPSAQAILRGQANRNDPLGRQSMISLEERITIDPSIC
ncbi:MAG: hypothetical protein ACRDIB_14695, partial [Ardenticatenaceae bacterium]